MRQDKAIREVVIDYLLEFYVNFLDIEDILCTGHKGYQNMSDEELILELQDLYEAMEDNDAQELQYKLEAYVAERKVLLNG